MTKISNQRAYIPDEEINGLDYLPGTDFDQALKTVNFRVQDLGTHYNQVNGVRNFYFNFYAHSGSNPKPADGYFYSNSNEQDPNNITYFVFSKKTARFKDTTNFFESISTENPFDLIIAQKVDINTIFFFRIDSIETFSGYYKLNVSEVFFPNGKELSYTLSNAVFNLKAEGISVHNQLNGLNEGDYIHLTAAEKTKFDNLPNSFATKTSDLTNDGADATSTYVESDELGAVAFSNDYNDLDNKPTIPTVITNHSGLSLDDGTNPHGTTKQDVGLGDVPNLNTTEAVNKAHEHTNFSVLNGTEESFTTALKNAYNSAVSWITTNGTNLINHLNNISNPHNVTKSQVGLGSVDNTSDADKPISTATQVALNLKLNKDTTAGVERSYIINADGSQSTKATSEFKDVLEFANFSSFPITGESEKIYIDLFYNFTYRWNGSVYVPIGNVPEVEQQLQRYWYSMTVNTLNTTLMLVNNTNSFTISGTASIVSRSWTLYYNSFAMNNYLSATANGSNCGIKNNNQGDGSYLEGFDSSFVFINNDTNVNCETTVGYYGLLSAIPNIPKSAYNIDFVGVGNDVGDVNLSFYCKRNTETPSYTKVDCGSAFPAHTTTDAYILRMQMSRGYNGSGRTLKMTIRNIITGAVFSHTFTDAQIPAHSRNIAMVVNRSNRNTGVATNIRFSKWHQTKYIY